MKFNSFIVSILCFFFAACNKESLPTSKIEPVVFETQAVINGQAQTFSTDVSKGQYMYADFFDRDLVFDVIELYGTLSQPNCPTGDCPGSFRIEFRNIDTGKNLNIEEVLRPLEYEYTDRNLISNGASIYNVILSAKQSGAIDTYSWEILDIVNNLIGNPVTSSIPDKVPRIVTLTKKNNNYISTNTRIIIPDSSLVSPKAFPNVNFFQQLDSQQNILTLTAVGIGNNLSYKWSNTTLTGPTIEVPVMDTSKIEVTVTDNVSKQFASASITPLRKMKSGEIWSSTEFNYDVIKTTLPPSLQLRRVAVQWVDPQGVVWRSDRRSLQQGFFVINKAEPYLLNEKGVKTYKVSFNFECRLFEPNGEFITASGKGVMAVGYP